jgi:hypothetical protein
VNDERFEFSPDDLPGPTQYAGVPLTYLLLGVDDAPLYVGCSQYVGTRWRTHRCQREWWPDVRRIVAFRSPDRQRAYIREQAFIRQLQPAYNIMGRQ